MSDFSPASRFLAQQPVARLIGQLGYVIDGDSVHLNADIEWNDRALASSGASAWALQLWARPASSAANADSIKVAELPLTIGADGQALPQRVEGWGFAVPPAGADAYTMVLELRAGDSRGFDTVHDQVAFARDERFVQPRLGGTGGYRFDGGSVRLEVDRIENPRAFDNLSGSLSLELWASEEPYRGGEVRGQRVGAAALGRLSGQSDWSPVGVDAETQPLPAGRWHLSLMLREWSAAGWVTRDFIGFSAPHHVAEVARATGAETVPALVSDVPDSIRGSGPDSQLQSEGDTESDSSSTPISTEIPSRVTSALAAAAQAFEDAPTLAPATRSTPTRTATKPVASSSIPTTPVAKAALAPSPLAKPKRSPAEKKKPTAIAATPVSINEATADELATVKGLPKAVALAIVAARPHASLEGLLNVKGMGPKLLDKLRASLCV